ncbi:GAF domain-containing protein [Umezawaea sp. Da 62-37]|uniref:GAF domain-containing protein n=1 Tax=Umezawaea sp. Da 62-37 TaxID=3075927 RepID=UPI0028F6FC1D|nr:GAF domain-containing protein [Umezawaea sp. Da 62-37]WNV82846.1 GAF domain-containing protein [Umezawaea sp. Da 62-37]
MRPVDESESRSRALSRVYDAVLGGGSGEPRPVISESWHRSLAARVDPDQREAPVVYAANEVLDLREAHPLASVLPMLRETLVSIADEAMHVMIITDAHGNVLWCEGESEIRRLADRVHLTEGARWSEEASGTNAMGTALALGRPVTVHSAEHLVRAYHGWTCAASPVRDPDTGRMLGVVDISGPLRTVHPAMGALVSAAARLAEGQLQLQVATRDERLRARNMRHLTALRGEPGALLSPTGRVLATEPLGMLPARIAVDVDRLVLPDGRVGVLEPLAEGARCTEDAIGTNAVGIALAVDTPVVVHSAEHLVRTYHGWTCAASPVHDPDTGATIGSVDISGPLSTVHPAMGPLVAAAAKLAENALRLRLDEGDERLRSRNMRHLIALRGEPGALLGPTGRVLVAEPHGLLPARIDPTLDRVRLRDGREGVLEPLAEGFLLRVARPTGQTRQPLLSLTFLGIERPGAVLNGRELPLTSRHAELLTALALHPRGLTADQLALKVYGARGNPATVRAELHRLRAQLGAGTLLTKPYRLRAEVRGDFVAVRDALRRGDVTAAASGYRGALLPRSEAPVVRDEREDLLAGVRRAVIAAGDAEGLWEFTRTDGGCDDVEALDRLVRALPRDDVRRDLVAGQLRRASASDG